MMHEKKRQIIQLACAVIYNCNLGGFAKGQIYKGNIKAVCVPGLNCYSCPGAVVSCPLGSLQSALVSARYKIPCYILGLLLLFGIVLGRTVCGFLCPFGFLQELIYRIPSKKINKNRWTARLSRFKYIILAVFVIGIPLAMSVPGFCKYICPAGTLEGGIPLSIANEQIRGMLGNLFRWKLIVMLIIFISAIFIFRSFCRFLCPLGAFYSFFHKTSVLGMEIDAEKCTGCQKCVKHCLMDVRCVGDGECIQCGGCEKECPAGAIVKKRIAIGKREC